MSTMPPTTRGTEATTTTVCRDLELSIMAFFDGELPRGEEDAVIGHLESCTACREELGEQRALRGRLEEVAAQPPPPESLRARLGLALDAEGRIDELARRRQRLNQWLIPGGASVVAAAALLLAVIATRTNTQTTSNLVGSAPTGEVAAEAARQLVRAAPLEVQGATATPPWVQRHFDAGLLLPASAKPTAREGLRGFASGPAADPTGAPDPSTSPAMDPLRKPSDAAIKLQGARLSSFRGRDAILLQYVVERGSAAVPMQVLAFAANGVAWDHIARTRQNGRDLYLDEHLGVRAVATVDHGYAYVFASSAMSHDDLAQIVASMNWCSNDPSNHQPRC